MIMDIQVKFKINLETIWKHNNFTAWQKDLQIHKNGQDRVIGI
jgi:hypothetical protein